MKLLKSIILIFVSVLVIPEEKPKVLIIGDSISIGYTPFVQKALEGKAEVFRNPGNAQHTGKGLVKLEKWIGEEKWEVIHFNWGLWDLCYRNSESKEQGKKIKFSERSPLALWVIRKTWRS